ncbi:MAG: hypothetical protein ACE5R6_02450 [Candidatus Heimdallarchaeota archaeon]
MYITLLSVISEFNFSLIYFESATTGIAMYFLSMGTVLVLIGGILFLRKYPFPVEQPQMEEAVNAH